MSKEQNSNNPQTQQLNIADVMRSCLLAIADGKVKCDMDYPNYGKIKVEIIGVNLTNIEWKPINVKVLDKGLKKEVERLEEYNGWGNDFEKPTHLVKHKESYTEDWVDVRLLSNYT
jgi:hypothetical protein